MNESIDLAAFERAWTNEAPSIPANAQRRAQREVMRWRAGIVIECLFGLGAIAVATCAAFRSTNPDMVPVAVAVWVFTLSLLGSSAWNKRGLGRLASSPTSRFLQFQIQRRRAVRREVRFGVAMWLVELLFVVTWRTQHPDVHSPLVVAAKWVVVLLVLLWLIWLEVRAVHELRQLESVREQLDLV